VHGSAAPWSIRGYHSLFPQLRVEIHVTLVEESSSGARIRELFHQCTALITTTSFISVIFFDSFCESLCVCENPHFSNLRMQCRKSSDRRISTVSMPPACFILGTKASTVRQRVISAGESHMTGTGTAREESQSMEFSVTKSALLNELTTTQGVVERKTTIPILSNLLVDAKGSRVTITATDLELSVRTSCEANVKKEGAGTIPAKKLLELVRLLPEGEIKFKLLDNHWVEIVSDKKKYKLVGMAKENFPALPAMPHTLVKLPAVVLESLIAKTKFAISMEESRYTLNGGLLILKPDTLAMVATDGHRLALAETDQKLAGLNGEVRVLIPKKAMDEVEKLSAAAGSDAHLEFAKDESHLFFQVGHRLLISRILTGQFPNYEAVLPRENNKTVVLERAELSDAVRRVSQLADQRSHAVKLAVSSEGVEISASSPEYGEAKETIDKDYKGDNIAIGFNSSYMLDFLAAAADGPISIELKDEQSAGQMRPLADESYRYRYVIMPMRI
jgi:DNA polymerase-3 subunit beta